jgi:predicted transcriptional regulator
LLQEAKMNLKDRREKLRLSQSRLAMLSGVSRFKICLHELGERRLKHEELARIDRAIQTEVDRLRDSLSEAA